MHPHRQSFEVCHGHILRNFPQGDLRDELIAILQAVRSRPLKDSAMMRIGDFISGGADKEAVSGVVRSLGYLCSSPAAVLNASGIIAEGGRMLRIAPDAVTAALQGEPVHHPVTGKVLEDAAKQIQLCYDLRPEALIDKLCSERDLTPGPALPGVLLICPDDRSAKELAAHAGWSLTRDEPEEDPGITRGAIGRAMRNGIMVFAAIDAIPEGLHLDPALLALHPGISTDEGLANRATRIIERIGGAPGLPHGARRSDADLVRMATGFRVDADHEIVSRGEGRWAISRGSGSTLNTDFEWEYEPMPSNRDDDYLSRNRFTLEEAFAHFEAWVARCRAAAPAP